MPEDDHDAGSEPYEPVVRDAKSPNMECGPLSQSIRFFVMRANRILSQAWNSSPLEQSMHLAQWFAFALIGANPGVSLVELARYIAADKSRVSELLDSMEQEELIVRRRSSKDHRMQGIYLTAAGVAKLGEITQEVEGHEEKLRRLYSVEETEKLIMLLARIRPD
jgi:DNA-binding MarR family transcriptional regulator